MCVLCFVDPRKIKNLFSQRVARASYKDRDNDKDKDIDKLKYKDKDKDKDKVQKRSYMWHILEKKRVQGYQN